jgi:hypothetical protein
MDRVITTQGNQKTFTISAWVKRTEVNSSVDGFGHTFFFGGAYGNEAVILRFNTGTTSNVDALQIGIGIGTTQNRSYTQRKFRDTSAWYHIVLAVDTTQATATDRFKLYVNGVLETEYASRNNPAQNLDTGNNKAQSSTYANNIGAYKSAGTVYGKFCGYIAQVYNIDGSALAPTAFGEFDEDSGIWKPIEYTGSFPNNSFYLDFQDSSDLGAQAKGDDRNFTTYNITSADQATDTPTNNFCTLNFNTGYIQGSDATTFTQGATTRQGGSSSYNGALGTIGINPFVGSAKWYWEVELSANNNGDGIELGAGWLATSIIQSTTADKATAGNSAGFQIWTSFDYDPPGEGTGADGDVFGFLLQCDSSNPNLKIYKNDTLFTTRHTATSYDFENDFYFPIVFIYNTGMKAFCNFGNPFDATVSSGNTDPNGYGNFEFDTKSGYALCTKNLAEYG